MRSDGDEFLFHEEQSFHQPWLWGLPFGLLVVFGVVLQQQPDKVQVLLPVAILVILVATAIAALMSLMKLTVTVDAETLYIRFVPFAKKDISLHEITGWEARTYAPIREYGGWGVRITVRNGRAYNVSGDRGVQLELTGGERILIGSQRGEELAEAISRAKQPAS